MIFIEMSRDELHGGAAWDFTKCVWAPIKKQGGGDWPFWTKIASIKKGDIVIHLRGAGAGAAFAGYSEAASDGYVTENRPPEPGQWAYSSAFYRADLTTFVPFSPPIKLSSTFAERSERLIEYFEANKIGKNKANLFFVRQSGRLQCLNGAYLSDVDEYLFDALFNEESGPEKRRATPSRISVATGQQLTVVRGRLGQAAFSKSIKALYGNSCCFPECEIADERFLVAAHIARWCDNEALRGHLGNGMCFCLMHDKAFELGLFTLDENFKIYVNKRISIGGLSFSSRLKNYHGVCIKLAAVLPMREALSEHWRRFNLHPFKDISTSIGE